MNQLSLDLPKNKNGNGSQGRRERNLASDLERCITDLNVAEQLRREQLRQVAQVRAQVYRHAKARGITPTMLRAARQLMRGAGHA